jgi:hypothetical protein
MMDLMNTNTAANTQAAHDAAMLAANTVRLSSLAKHFAELGAKAGSTRAGVSLLSFGASLDLVAAFPCAQFASDIEEEFRCFADLAERHNALVQMGPLLDAMSNACMAARLHVVLSTGNQAHGS